jgi:hypothetical protein
MIILSFKVCLSCWNSPLARTMPQRHILGVVVGEWALILMVGEIASRKSALSRKNLSQNWAVLESA